MLLPVVVAMTYIFSRMVLLVAPSRRALPPLAVSVPHKRLIVSRPRGAEARVAAALRAHPVEALVSVGFSGALDRRLAVGDLVMATRVYGGPDVYLDLPPMQAPGALRGSLCTLPNKPVSMRAGKRSLPPVLAVDGDGFWLARAAAAAGVPCILLRAVLRAGLAADEAYGMQPQLLAGRLVPALGAHPDRWAELPELLRHFELCRAHLASALSVLLVLHERRR